MDLFFSVINIYSDPSPSNACKSWHDLEMSKNKSDWKDDKGHMQYEFEVREPILPEVWLCD